MPIITLSNSIKFAATFTGDGITTPLDIPAVSFSNDFVGDGTASPISIKPYYFSNLFTGTGTTIDPVTINILNLIPIKTPKTSKDPCKKGDIWRDSNFLYIAVDNNSLKRIALQSF